MPKIDAVSKRNWAITVQLPAATSCASLMHRDVNAKMTAATNDAEATVYSMALDFIISEQIA